jgi:hypothetical protein
MGGDRRFVRRRRGSRWPAPLGGACAVAVGLLGAFAGVAEASDPELGLRPGDVTPAHAQASADAEADGVHIGISWRETEPRPNEHDWSRTDDAVFNFATEGVPIASIRVTDAPDWAIYGGRCPVKLCPPTFSHYDDFEQFVSEVVTRYGPLSPSSVDRFVLWNEPDRPSKWGGLSHREGSHRDYSALLARFHDGATAANPLVAVDAGEVATGNGKGRDWTRKFTRHNTRHGRNGNYDAFNIHAYSRFPGEIVDKIKAYGRMPGVERIGVSEFGWAVGNPNPAAPGSGDFKCTSASGQASKLRRTVRAIRADTSSVGHLVWQNGIDERRDKTIKCIDGTGYYNGSVRDRMNTYGLYRRAPDGSLSRTDPRPARNDFRALATGT